MTSVQFLLLIFGGGREVDKGPFRFYLSLFGLLRGLKGAPLFPLFNSSLVSSATFGSASSLFSAIVTHTINLAFIIIHNPSHTAQLLHMPRCNDAVLPQSDRS